MDVDEKYFLEATREYESGNLAEAKWAKILALCEGDAHKAQYRYITERANELMVSAKAKQHESKEAERQQHRERLERIENVERSNYAVEAFNRLINGEYGLARTFWLFNVLVRVLFFALFIGFLRQPDHFHYAFTVYVVYQFPVLLGIVKAADNYSGFALWAVLARIEVIAQVIGFASFFIMLVDGSN